jgi:uncharacterized membrane protein (DUF106 family)
MSLLSTILSGGANKIMKSIGGIIDNVHTSDAERLAFAGKKDEIMLAVETMMHAERQEEEKTIQKTIKARMSIIVAELQQSSLFVKSARPMIIYVGLFIMLWSAIAPTFGAVVVAMPDMFWVSWTGVAGAYAVGRTAEKKGSASKTTQLMAGPTDKIDIGI